MPVLYYLKNRPTSFKNEQLVNTYTVLSDESVWRGKYIKSESPLRWSVPNKNIIIEESPQYSFSCGQKRADVSKYSSFTTGTMGGWNSLYIVDCGDYYFVYEYGDAGPRLFGPFDALKK